VRKLRPVDFSPFKKVLVPLVFKRPNHILMEKWEDLATIERDPNKVSGAWVFRGTRVPVAALFEILRDGDSVDQFLAWFPGVGRTQVEMILNHEVSTLAEVQ
jgi:uncharacterized protein (DUF433 family)